MHDRHFGKTVVIALGIAAAPLASACSNGNGGKEPPLSPTSEISIPTSPVETTSPLPAGPAQTEQGGNSVSPPVTPPTTTPSVDEGPGDEPPGLPGNDNGPGGS